jgi:GNAT superfamily N-acetyltransferase
MTELSIRRATPDDAAVITSANIALAAESEHRILDPEVVARGVRRLLAEPAWGVYYVAERDGRVVGQMLITYEFSDWRDGMFWWIQSVYVWPEARRCGVYRALHQYIEHTARTTPGICGLRLYVDDDNTRAQATYTHLGLKRTEYHVMEADWRL